MHYCTGTMTSGIDLLWKAARASHWGQGQSEGCRVLFPLALSDSESDVEEEDKVKKLCEGYRLCGVKEGRQTVASDHASEAASDSDSDGPDLSEFDRIKEICQGWRLCRVKRGEPEPGVSATLPLVQVQRQHQQSSLPRSKRVSTLCRGRSCQTATLILGLAP